MQEPCPKNKKKNAMNDLKSLKKNLQKGFKTPKKFNMASLAYIKVTVPVLKFF